MQARESILRSPLVDLSDIGPLVRQTGSDSESLDNALEVLLAGGLDLLTAMRVLVPPAFAAREDIDEDLAAFYEYYALHSEPWDGPAGLVMCDGRYAACTLDRNGLRPARWALSDDNHLIVASEAGLWDVPPARRRQGPARAGRDDRGRFSSIGCCAMPTSTRSTASARRSATGCARA
jgi:glutamate synthase (NADPH/NADH) large chain